MGQMRPSSRQRQCAGRCSCRCRARHTFSTRIPVTSNTSSQSHDSIMMYFNKFCWMHLLVTPIGLTTWYDTQMWIVTWPPLSCPILPAGWPPMPPTGGSGAKVAPWIWLKCSEALSIFRFAAAMSGDIEHQKSDVLVKKTESKTAAFSLKACWNWPTAEILVS